MNQNEEIRVLYVQPGKYPEEIKIPNTLETFQKYVCGSIESVRLDRDAYIICNDEGKLLPLPPNRLYGPTDFFAGPFLICGDGGEDLISLTDSQITKYEKKYHSPLISLELYPKPITLKCTPDCLQYCMLNAWERNISMMHRKMSAMRDKSICMENRENGLCSY